jgi:hypothetical protein
MPSHLLMWGLLVPTSMSLLILPVSLDTYKNLTPGFLLLSNYLLLSPDPFLLLPFTSPPPSRHVWDDQRSLHLGSSRCIHRRACLTLVPPPPPFLSFFSFFLVSFAVSFTLLNSRHCIMKPWHAPRHVEVVVLVAERTHPVRLRTARDPLATSPEPPLAALPRGRAPPWPRSPAAKSCARRPVQTLVEAPPRRAPTATPLCWSGEVEQEHP